MKPCGIFLNTHSTNATSESEDGGEVLHWLPVSYNKQNKLYIHSF